MTRTNLILNPDLEVDTTGWSATSGTISRQTNRYLNGTASLEAVHTNPSAAQACFYGVTVTGLTIGTVYTASCFTFKNGSSYAQMVVNDGTNHYGTPAQLGSVWEKIFVTFTAAATTVTVGVTNATAISTSNQKFNIDTLTLTEGTNTEPFSPYTPAVSGLTYLPNGAVGNSTTTTGTGRVNLLKNPSFESGTKYGWNGTVDAGTTTIDSTVGLFGTKSLRSNCTGTFHRIRGTNGAGNQAEMVPVTPGHRYTFSGWMWSPDPISAWQLYVTGANSAGTTTAQYSGGGNVNSSTTNWVRNKVSFTAAAGDAYIWPTIDMLGTSGRTYYWDGFLIEETGGNTDLNTIGPYFDGDTTTNDWVVNSWTGTPHASTSLQVPNPAHVPPVVNGIYTSAVGSGTTTTVNLTATPATGDVLVLVTWWQASAANPPVASVSGCGAVWEQVAGASAYTTIWVGKGATASGTVTATHTAVAGRAMRLYHISGTSADVAMRDQNHTYPQFANPDQVVIGLGYDQTSSTPGASLASGARFPVDGWVDSAEVLLGTTTKRAMTSHLIPKALTDVWHYGGGVVGGTILVGSGRAGFHVSKRNWGRNASMESTAGWSSPVGGVLQLSSAQVVAGTKSIGGVTTGNNGRLLSTSATDMCAVRPNTQYTFSVYVWCNAARTAAIAPVWKQHAQGSLSQPAWVYQALTANAWTRITWTGTSPYDPAAYGAYWAMVDINSTTLTGDTIYFDALQIEEGPTATAYMDGDAVPAAGDYNVYNTLFNDVGNRWPYLGDSYTLTADPTPPTGPVIKVWQSGAWVVKHPVAKARIAGAWVAKPLRYWNGTAWVDLF